MPSDEIEIRKITGEQSPQETEANLKEWLSRFKIDVNSCVDTIVERVSYVEAEIVPTINSAEVLAPSEVSTASTDTQPILVQDVPTQISFGPAQINDAADIDALGTVTFKEEWYYDYVLTLNAYKSSQPMSSYLLIYFTVNNVPSIRSFGVQIHNVVDLHPIDVIGTAHFNVGDVVKLWMVSDTAGMSDNGLDSFTPTNGSVPAVPSASLVLRRRELFVEELVHL